MTTYSVLMWVDEKTLASLLNVSLVEGVTLKEITPIVQTSIEYVPTPNDPIKNGQEVVAALVKRGITTSAGLKRALVPHYSSNSVAAFIHWAVKRGWIERTDNGHYASRL